MELIHDFRDGDRWAQVHENRDGEYIITCFIKQVFQGQKTIRNHSEQYAEDAAENYVLGIWDLGDEQ